MNLQDAIYELLGVPPEQQPADFYRLLGLARYETNREVIANAASRQMLFVRQLAAGPYSALSQDLLDLLAEAKVCLLNSERRRAYDAELRQRTTGQHASGNSTAASVVAAKQDAPSDIAAQAKAAIQIGSDEESQNPVNGHSHAAHSQGEDSQAGLSELLESIGSISSDSLESIGSSALSITSAFGPNPAQRVMAHFGKPLTTSDLGPPPPTSSGPNGDSARHTPIAEGSVFIGSIHEFASDSTDTGTPRAGGSSAAVIGKQWVIGADDHCDIVVRCPYVSRRHCRITESGGRFWVEDLGSRNGTHVNNRVVNGRVAVNADDLVTLGTLARMPWPPATEPFLKSGGAGNEVRIIRIGRSPSNDITLNHASVSRRHAQLTVFGNHTLLEDLGSTNGTFIGDSALRINRRKVTPSDSVRIGKFIVPVSHLLRNESVA